MQNCDYYRLEIPCRQNSKKFSILEITSLSLKILSLLCLIILFRYFYIAVVLWVLSIVLNCFKRNLIYKYVYTINDGTLTVEKEYNYDKKIICEQTKLNEVVLLDKESDTKYYENPQEIILTVKLNEKEFSIDVDEYFYALADYYNKNGENNDFFG